jgi:tetratricopeptide (TPR) repeat protein
LGMFAIAPIPWSLVENCQPGVEAEDLEDTRDDGLMARSLLKRVGDGSYQLHQIVQEYFRIKLGEMVDQGQAIKVSFWWMMLGISQDIDQKPTITQIEQIRESITHLEEGVRSWIDSVIDENLIWPFEWISRFYEGQGNYSFAEPWRRECLKAVRKRVGDNHKHVATSLNNLSQLYSLQGKYDEAESLLHKALEIDKHLFGEEHPYVATNLNNLAQLHCLQGRYDEAEPLLHSVLEKRIRLLGEQHLDVATSLSNLAQLYYLQKKYDKAEPLFCSALDMRKRMLGEHHPYVALSQYSLGVLYQSQGRHPEAEALYHQALPIAQSKLGFNHPHTQGIQSWLNSLPESSA